MTTPESIAIKHAALFRAPAPYEGDADPLAERIEQAINEAIEHVEKADVLRLEKDRDGWMRAFLDRKAEIDRLLATHDQGHFSPSACSAVAVPPPAAGSVTHSKEIRFEDADPKNPLTREEMLWVDATPDADYPIRILRAYLRNTTLRTISEPPLLGEIMNKAQDERAVILQDAIDRLTDSRNTEVSNDQNGEPKL